MKRAIRSLRDRGVRELAIEHVFGIVAEAVAVARIQIEFALEMAALIS